MRSVGYLCLSLLMICVAVPPAFTQEVYVDPAQITLLQSEDPIRYTHDDFILVGVATTNWAVTCSAEPLLHAASGSQIPLTQIYIKHDLIDVYQPFTTAMDLGTGTSFEDPYNAIINRLSFQVQLNGSEWAGQYMGTVHFFNHGVEAAQLLLIVDIFKSLAFAITPSRLESAPSSPNLYAIAPPIDVSITNSNTTDWHIDISILSSSSFETFNGDNIMVRSSLTENTDDTFGPGFQPVNDHPYIISGDRVGRTGQALLEFRILTTWSVHPGNYHVVVALTIPELNLSRPLDLYIDVTEYSSFSLSETALYFHANGPPNIWPGDKSPILTVGTNCSSWGVTCDATSLTSPDDEIPNSRIYMKIEPDAFTGDVGAGIGFHKLDATLVVAEGSALPPQEVAQMWFKLQTLDIDRPGRYQGTITFTFLTDP